jgi:hypothetical protein
LTYQLGNLIAAGAFQIEAGLATRSPLASGHPDYSNAMSLVMICVFAAVIIMTALGYFVVPEHRNAELAAE